MANSETIKTTIDVNINTNGNQAITGAVMNSVLKQMVDSTDEQFTELSEQKEDKANKVTSLTDESTDEQYPSAKAVYELKERISENEVLIEDLQNSKIDKEADDYYPQLSVGVADNLAGHEDATPSEIGFRRSGGGAILDGNARIESIKGNSVVWNQLINENKLVASDASITKTAIGYTITPSGAAPGLKTNAIDGGVTPVVGHKYALLCEKTGGTKRLYLNWGGYNTSLSNPFFTASDSSKTQLTVYSYQETETFTLTKPRLIDITKAFPNDWQNINTIEEFYARIPSGIDEHAYNEGKVIHNATDKIESVGVNQWDEEWELGEILSNGTPTSSQTAIRSKNFNPIIEGQTYNFHATDARILIYDKNYTFIDFWSSGALGDRAFLTPQGSSYFKISSTSNYGSVYKGDICINLSDPSVNGKYFPYVKREQSLDIIGKYFPNGMKSAGTAHDEIRYNKTTQKWEMVQRIGSVDLGTLSWTLHRSGKMYAPLKSTNTQYPMVSPEWGYIPFKCATKYQPIGSRGLSDETEEGVIYAEYKQATIVIYDPTYTDAESFKAAMQGVILYYELAEPIVTEIEETINLDYTVWNVGTEKASANVPSTPLKADIIYGFNAYGVIKELFARVASLEAANASLASQLASVTSHNEEV